MIYPIIIATALAFIWFLRTTRQIGRTKDRIEEIRKEK
jgi:hypothetical protein